MTRRVLALAALLVLPRVAAAQTETKAAVAEALYRQARDLMAAAKYDEACPKFAQSQKLDPATGTLLNLAACHEKQGKLATAWLEYSDAQVAARRDAREDRVQYARERAQELEPRLSRLTLLLAPDADTPGLAIELDGASVGSAVLGAPTPVDPGKHSVHVSAPYKKPLILEIQIGAAADQQSLTIPALVDAPAETETAAPAQPPARASDGATPGQPPGDELATRPVPTSVYLAGGITLALAAGAGVTGIAYLQKKADYDDLAQTGLSDDVQTRRDRAQKYGYVNLGLWIGTAIGAGVTTYLFVSRPKQHSAIHVSPWLAPQVAGLGVSGGF